MHITRCYLDGQYFQLEVNVDRAALERAVLAATGRGSSFLRFTTADSREISALITPHTSVHFETVDHGENTAEDGVSGDDATAFGLSESWALEYDV